MKCENCGKEHDGSYGSGRFCSKKCRGAFSRKGEIKHKRGEPWICEYCNKTFKSRNLMYRHKHVEHSIKRIWNKGSTKDTDHRILKCIETLKKRILEGSVKNYYAGKHLPIEMREKISKSMKKAHAEGRAHNICECRWNNKPSWPEKWFMQVIENEFEDKTYKREFPFYRFSLDFAWTHKKRVIEIDGEQHYRDQAQQKRDKEKDKLLANEGWKELRLNWKWVCNNTKEAIKIAKDFIDF